MLVEVEEEGHVIQIGREGRGQRSLLEGAISELSPKGKLRLA